MNHRIAFFCAVAAAASVLRGSEPDCPDGSCALDGKTIAIVGGSFMANVTHPELRRLLLAEFPTAKTYVLSEIGSAGPYPRPGVVRREKDAFQRKLRELGVDAVVSGNGGCGLCTPKETGSCIAPAAASSSTPPEVPRTGPAPDSGAAGPAPGPGAAPRSRIRRRPASGRFPDGLGEEREPRRRKREGGGDFVRP